MSSTQKKIFTLLAICSFIISIIFVCACVDSLAQKVFEIVIRFKPMKADRLEQLKGVLLGNAFLFFVFGILFILLQFLKFEEAEETIHFFPKNLKRIRINQRTIAVVLTFLGISCIRFYWLNQKISFHEDEIYSVSIVTQNEYGLWSGKDFNQNQAYTGKQIKDAIFFDDASIKDTFRDLAHLWIYNRDAAHNNLYLYLCRIWFTGFKSSDFKAIFFRAGLLNYLFFCFSFYFLYLILTQITNNILSKILILLASFLNPASVGLSLFMRSYALQETTLILFVYVFIFYYKNIINHKNIMSLKNLIRTSIVITLVFSTDYFPMILVAVLGLVLVFTSIKQKNGKIIHYLFCAVFLGFLFTKITYINYGTGFFSGRGAEAFSTISAGSHTLQTVYLTNTFISKNMLPFFIMIIIMILSCFYNFITTKKIISINIIIFFSAISFIFIILYVTPVIALRYIAVVFVFLPFGMLFLIKKSRFSYVFYVVQSLITICVILNVMPIKQNFNKIEHLNDSKKQYVSSKFFNDISTPVVIRNRADYPNILPYLKDEEIVYFASSIEQAKTYDLKTDKFWYVDVIKKDNILTLTEELIVK